MEDFIESRRLVREAFELLRVCSRHLKVDQSSEFFDLKRDERVNIVLTKVLPFFARLFAAKKNQMGKLLFIIPNRLAEVPRSIFISILRCLNDLHAPNSGQGISQQAFRESIRGTYSPQSNRTSYLQSLQKSWSLIAPNGHLNYRSRHWH